MIGGHINFLINPNTESNDLFNTRIDYKRDVLTNRKVLRAQNLILRKLLIERKAGLYADGTRAVKRVRHKEDKPEFIIVILKLKTRWYA